MDILLIDGIKDVVLHNGMLRVDCVAAGPNGTERPSGTVLIPGNIAGAVVQALSNALTEFERRLREQQQQTGTA
jgi:hypothetical protein